MKNHPYRKKYQFEENINLGDDRNYQDSDNDDQLEEIPQSFLKHYIKHAREHIHPKLSAKNHDIIRTFFNKLR